MGAGDPWNEGKAQPAGAGGMATPAGERDSVAWKLYSAGTLGKSTTCHRAALGSRMGAAGVQMVLPPAGTLPDPVALATDLPVAS